MKICLQVAVILACSMFANNLTAAADNKTMLTIQCEIVDACNNLLKFSIPFDDKTTIREIKEQICSVKNIPVEKQILYKIESIKSPFMIAYMKRWIELKDEQTCANYSIQSCTILRLCLINNSVPA